MYNLPGVGAQPVCMRCDFRRNMLRRSNFGFLLLRAFWYPRRQFGLLGFYVFSSARNSNLVFGSCALLWIGATFALHQFGLDVHLFLLLQIWSWCSPVIFGRDVLRIFPDFGRHATSLARELTFSVCILV